MYELTKYHVPASSGSNPGRYFLIDITMNPGYAHKLLIPQEYSEHPEFKVDEKIARQLKVEYFKDVALMVLTEEDCVQLVLLPEQDFTTWFQREFPAKLSLGVILLESPEGNQVPDPESDQVMAWIDPKTISKRHWNYLLRQSLVQLTKKRQMVAMQFRINRHDQQFHELNEIGISLSSEKDLKKLLDLIVSKSMRLTSADGGSLYLLQSIPGVHADPDNFLANKVLNLQVALNLSRDIKLGKEGSLKVNENSIYGQAILQSRSIIIEDVYNLKEEDGLHWGGHEVDLHYNYRTKSILTVPMFNHRHEAVGVIQLVNRKSEPDKFLVDLNSILEEVQSFDEMDAKFMQSVASQAAVALENAELFDSIQILFDGFINASVKAIESRDPTTSGHSSRVATLTIALAETTHQLDHGPYASVRFTQDQLNEVRYASLLHDFGKIGVQERVLVKSKKLYPEEEHAVMDRFRLIRQGLKLEMTQRQLSYFLDKTREEALVKYEDESNLMRERLEELDDALKFIVCANEPTVLAQGGFEKLHEIGKKLFNHPSGIQAPYLNPYEVGSLSVPKGTLNEKDRQEIESHVTHTYNFLSIIPWSVELANVPDIAYAHHEKLDGSGYPRKLKCDEIPIQAKMMTIADIYDALTAWDRPYKKSMPAERALNILGFEAKDQHVDQNLLNLFIDAKLYQLVARPNPVSQCT